MGLVTILVVLALALGIVCGSSNIAKRRPAYASSMYSSSYRPNRAVDGYTSSYFHSAANNINPWWAVKLKAPTNIMKVVISNVGGSSGYYLHDIMVGVTNKHPSSYHPFPGGYKLCHTHIGGIKPGATVSFRCRPNIRGKYVVVQMPGKHRYLILTEVAVYAYADQGNVAKAKAVWESSHKNGVNRAKKAVDGSRASSGVQGQCSQTKLQADPWWVVDLGASYAIKNVIITNRGDCCAYRLSYFVVGVTDKSPVKSPPKVGSYTVCNAHIGAITRGSSKTITCDSVVQGRYVIVQIPGQYRILTLCEVEVYIY